jgi:hypothetical protein
MAQKITPFSAVSSMKHALLELGCPSIHVTAQLAGTGIRITVETSHPKTGAITVTNDFTLAEYLKGPMQPIYFDLHRRVSEAVGCRHLWESNEYGTACALCGVREGTEQ